MNRFIITGASGFVGNRLVCMLAARGKEIIAVLRNEKSKHDGFDKFPNVRIIYSEMADYETLFEKVLTFEPECFIHLAWEGSTGEKRSDVGIQIKNIENSIGAYRLAEKLNCKKFMCAGTISENILEQVDSLNSISQNMIYAQAKKSLFEFLKIISKKSNTKLVWMQFSNAYGPNNRSGNLISYTFDTIDSGKIPEYGSGSQYYNFIYIDDLVNGIIKLAESDLRKVDYFIGSDEVLLLRDYLLKIPQIIEKKIEIGIGKRADDGIEYKKEWFDIRDLKEDTGYESEYSFEKGILNTYKNR